MEDKKQKSICVERYRRREDDDKQQFSEIDVEREEECGICMETNSKVVLPNCGHAMCMRCYHEWYSFFSQTALVIYPMYFTRYRNEYKKHCPT